MVSLKLQVRPTTDAVSEVRRVVERLQAEGLPPMTANGAAVQIEALLGPMINAARTAALSKARMELTQTVTGPGYTVDLCVDEGRPPSLLSKLRAALGLER